MASAARVVVVGAGIIGAAAAWRLAGRGHAVTLVDPEPGRGATWTAAGMLAPVTELHYGEERLLRLGLASAARYPDFVAELRAQVDEDVCFQTGGTVVAAFDAADLATLRDLQRLHTSLGLRSEMLSARELRALHPGLAAGLPGGLHAADDHAVDPRRLHATLLAAAERRGVRVARRTAVAIEPGQVRLADRPAPVDGDVLQKGVVDGDVVVLAAGAWSGQIDGVPADVATAVRPVKGQTVRLRVDARRSPTAATPRVVRGLVRGHSVYLVVRPSGEVVLGATSEEAGFDVRPHAGGVYELLRDAQLLWPEIAEFEFVEVSAGLRPGTRDNCPILTRAESGLVVATGHYRNGVLLAPATADAVVGLVETGALPPDLAIDEPLAGAAR